MFRLFIYFNFFSIDSLLSGIFYTIGFIRIVDLLSSIFANALFMQNTFLNWLRYNLIMNFKMCIYYGSDFGIYFAYYCFLF